MEFVNKKYNTIVNGYFGYYDFPKEFIKKHFDEYYTKKELKSLNNEDLYKICLYKVNDDEYNRLADDRPWISNMFFMIPEINDTIFHFTYNTSSRFAMELCGYDFMDDNEDNDNEDNEE